LEFGISIFDFPIAIFQFLFSTFHLTHYCACAMFWSHF
jgi:hypothetical protein